MKIIKKISTMVMCLASLTLSLFSCSEKEEAGEYDNWEIRNSNFIDSIAKVCEKNADGSWERICAYTLDEKKEATSPNKFHFIYVKKLEKGTGTYNATYKDSVRVHYLGRLIPSASYPEGNIFDKSYSSYTYNGATDVPTLFAAGGGTTIGFGTAAMHMVEGDHWLVYVPYYLGYGSSDNTSGGIPGYSTMIFDMRLAKIYKYLKDTDTSWH